MKVGREGEALRSAGSEFQTVGVMYPKERSPKVFRFAFGILSSLSVEERRGARWLICAERRRQVWRKSAVKVTESERCELVLNAVFYWEPEEFYQKRCDMITLWIFQDDPCGVVLDLLYARDLFIGYSCESSIAVVQY